MDSGDPDRITRAERLTQLAELHRQGVLNAVEYEAAAARLVDNPGPSPGIADVEGSFRTAPYRPDLGNEEGSVAKVEPSRSERFNLSRRVVVGSVVGTVLIALSVTGWIAWKNASSGEVEGEVLTTSVPELGCSLPMDAWARLVFTTQDGKRTEAPWFDPGSIVSEDPCQIAHRYSVRLEAGEDYEVALQLADPTPGLSLPLQPVGQITPDDYSDGRVDFNLSEGTVG